MQTSRFYKMRWKAYYSAYKGMPQVKNEAVFFFFCTNLPLASSARAQDKSVGKIGQRT